MEPQPQHPPQPGPVCPVCGESMGEQPFCTPCLFRCAVEARAGPSSPLAEDLPRGDGSVAGPDQDAEPTAGSRDGLPPTEFGDYRLQERIGEGGMGIVYRAYKLSLKKDVAIKFIKAGRHASDRQIALFLREAELASKLDHANIVTVSEVGQRGGHRYLVMRFIDGAPLSERLRSTDFLPALHDRVQFLARIARAVAHAHQRGVIHRDLKPGNILTDREGNPYVGDFGLARWAERDSTVTFGDRVVGTPAYMPPEQALGQRDALTLGSDVWSLGVMLYELISGRLPFEAGTVPAVVHRILEHEPASPFEPHPPSANAVADFGPPTIAASALAKLTGGARLDLESICLRCLEKESARRYPTAGALAEDLERWLEGRPVVARPVQRLERAVRWARRRPAVAGLVVACSVAVLALGASFWFNAEQRRTEEHRREFNYVADMNLVQAAWRETNFVVFERALAAADQSDLRGIEWGLMRTLGDAATQPVWFDAHQPLLDLAISPANTPGPHVAVVGTNAVFLLDAAARVLRRWPRRNDAGLAGLSFSPDATLLAVADSSGLDLLEVRDDRTPPTDVHLTNGIHLAVSFSPDGRWLASSARFPTETNPYPEEKVLIFDVHLRQLRQTLTNEARAFHWPADGRRLWIADERGAVTEWNIDTEETRNRVQGGFIGDTFRFAPTGRLLARNSRYGVVHLRDVSSPGGEAVRTYSGLPLRAPSLAFSPDETRFAMVTIETGIRISDLAQGAATTADRLLVPGHVEAISAISFTPDGQQILSASRDGTVRRLPLAGRERPSILSTPHFLATEAGVSPVFSPDSRRVALLERRATQRQAPFDPESTVLYDLASGSILGRLPAEVIGWGATNRVLTWDREGWLVLWDVTDPGRPAEVGRFRPNPDHHPQIDSQLAEGGRWVVSLTRDGSPRAFEAATGGMRHLEGLQGDALASSPSTPFAAIGIAPDSKREAGVALWNLAENRIVTMISGVLPADFRFSPSGRILVATGWNRQLQLYDGRTGQERQRLRGHLGTVMAVAFTEDERQLVTGGNDYSMVVWNMATGREVLRLQLPAPIAWIRVSPDQRWLATGHTPTEVGTTRTSLGPGHYRLWPISPSPASPAPVPRASQPVLDTIWDRFPNLAR